MHDQWYRYPTIIYDHLHLNCSQHYAYNNLGGDKDACTHTHVCTWAHTHTHCIVEKFHRVQFSQMVNLYHLVGLLTCVLTSIISRVYFVDLIFVVGWSSTKTMKIRPLKNMHTQGTYATGDVHTYTHMHAHTHTLMLQLMMTGTLCLLSVAH